LIYLPSAELYLLLLAFFLKEKLTGIPSMKTFGTKERLFLHGSKGKWARVTVHGGPWSRWTYTGTSLPSFQLKNFGLFLKVPYLRLGSVAVELWNPTESWKVSLYPSS
jgi:hypothetical protein